MQSNLVLTFTHCARIGIHEHVDVRGIECDPKTADVRCDSRHGRMSSHAPLRLSHIGASAGADEPAVPILLSYPLNEVNAVLRFVHIVVPALRLAFACAA